MSTRSNKSSAFSQLAPFKVRGTGYNYIAPQIGSIPLIPITPSDFIYLRPDGTSLYFRPSSTFIYIRP